MSESAFTDSHALEVVVPWQGRAIELVRGQGLRHRAAWKQLCAEGYQVNSWILVRNATCDVAAAAYASRQAILEGRAHGAKPPRVIHGAELEAYVAQLRERDRQAARFQLPPARPARRPSAVPPSSPRRPLEVRVSEPLSVVPEPEEQSESHEEAQASRKPRRPRVARQASEPAPRPDPLGEVARLAAQVAERRGELASLEAELADAVNRAEQALAEARSLLPGGAPLPGVELPASPPVVERSEVKASKKPRRKVAAEQPQASAGGRKVDQVAQLVERLGRATSEEVADELGTTKALAVGLLGSALRSGRIERLERGVYAPLRTRRVA